jgi:hypothetical protein
VPYVLFDRTVAVGLILIVAGCAPAVLRLPPDTTSVTAIQRPVALTPNEAAETCEDVVKQLTDADNALAAASQRAAARHGSDQVGAMLGGAVALAAVRQDSMDSDPKQPIYDARDHILLVNKAKGCRIQ